jgi:hypothetical protein
MDENAQIQSVSKPRWSVRSRLQFIEFRLFWSGRLNRSDLSDMFGISAQQGSADIAQYEKLAPGNLAYDKGQKAYLRTPSFDPILIGSSVDRFLLQIVAVGSGWLKKEDTWFDTMPTMEVVTLERQPTNPEVLLRVLDAIRNRQQIEMGYSSMTGSPSTHRVVAPHAMASAGGRWYVRAWSREHNDFRDYALARITEVSKSSEPSRINPDADLEWLHKIDLVLKPNPELDPERRRAVELENGMIDGPLVLPCRASMAFYLMAEHNLDVETGILNPHKQQLVLANRDEVERARSVIRQLSKQALQREIIE